MVERSFMGAYIFSYFMSYDGVVRMTRWATTRKGNKYRNTIIDTPEGKFHSKREYARWQELKLLEKAGEVVSLKKQVTYRLEVHEILICKWIVDFEYSVISILANGYVRSQLVVEDLKGFQSRESKLKVKLFKALYPNIEVRITK
jgi:hypothetical protein